MEGIERLLGEHPFFDGMRKDYLSIIAGCGANVRFDEGDLLGREGESADLFFAIRHGRVALEIPCGDEPITIQTLEEGDIVGWSWLFPPHRWLFDARALTTTRAIRFDCACLRTKCDADPVMGYDFMKRFAGVVVERLRATRLQLIDVYGSQIPV